MSARRLRLWRCRLRGHRWGEFDNAGLYLHHVYENATLKQQRALYGTVSRLLKRTGGSKSMPIRFCERCPSIQTWDEFYADHEVVT